MIFRTPNKIINLTYLGVPVLAFGNNRATQSLDEKTALSGRGGSIPENYIVLLQDGGFSLDVPITPEKDTVCINRNQMALLFDRDVKTIGKHINTALAEELNNPEDAQRNPTVAKFAIIQNEGGK
jgi:hypothetical protein